MSSARQILLLTLFLSLSGCGVQGESSTARIDFSDYWPFPEDTLAQTGDLQGDTGSADVVGVDASEADLFKPGPDAGIPGLCTPGTVTCEKGDVAQCNEKGGGYIILEECDDGDECTTDHCQNGMCLFVEDVPYCCTPPCPIGELCLWGECTCAPACLGKECGEDGCGGSCGDCAGGQDECVNGACVCQPHCVDMECGDDGCGGDCGVCLGEQNQCQDGACYCQGDCSGKVCGDDGCGSSCGECPVLHKCIEGVCAFYCPSCPNLAGCTAAPFQNHVYYHCPQSKDWGDAQGKCEEHISHLATVSSQQENDFLNSLDVDHDVWIGYYESWFEWKWVTGESKDFKNWDQGQPDDGSLWVIEDCAELRTNGKWNDNECGKGRHFICEHEPSL